MGKLTSFAKKLPGGLEFLQMRFTAVNECICKQAGTSKTCKRSGEKILKTVNDVAKLLSTAKTETSFLQQSESRWFPVDEHLSTGPSIPHVANSPENDTLEAASSLPQKCVAMVKCMPESRMRKANDMENSFFILSIKHK